MWVIYQHAWFAELSSWDHLHVLGAVCKSAVLHDDGSCCCAGCNLRHSRHHTAQRRRCFLRGNVIVFASIDRVLENMEISGNLVILENSGNLKFTPGIYQIVSLGHRVVCIIVSNSSINWLGGASHHAHSIKYSVILQESCRTDC